MSDTLLVDDIEIRDDGLLRLEGCTFGRLVVRVIDGHRVASFQYKDRNHNRSCDRGAELLEIPWMQIVRSVEEHLGSAVIPGGKDE